MVFVNSFIILMLCIRAANSVASYLVFYEFAPNFVVTVTAEVVLLRSSGVSSASEEQRLVNLGAGVKRRSKGESASEF